MAFFVGEIMSREVLRLRPEETVPAARAYLLTLGITAAPVTGAGGRAVGFVSLRDLIGAEEATVGEVMHAPVVSVPPATSIRQAGRLLADTGYHHLPVVEADDSVVGMVSSLDLLRAMLGAAVAHAPTSPHYDAESDALWTDDIPFELDRVESAPADAGVFLLVRAVPDQPDEVVWVEAARNVRARLIDLLTGQAPLFDELVPLGNLVFRAAALPDRAARDRVLARVRAEH